MIQFTWWWSEKTQRWRAIRAKGRARFVLLYGVLGWGLGMFVIMSVLPMLFGWPRWIHIHASLLLGSVLWILGGVLWGIFMWFDSERRFQRHEAEL
jgi:hypothetical protein